MPNPFIQNALVPLSADPITKGHIHIILRAAAMVKNLTIVILNNPQKKYTFDLKERIKLTETIFESYKNISIKGHSGLLADFAYSNGIPLIIRGIRNEADFLFEKSLEFGNTKQWQDLETIFLLSRPEFRDISSSFVKSIVEDCGNIQDYVTPNVQQALEEKYLSQYRLAVTGSIACGKTTVSKMLIKKLDQMGILAHYLDLDQTVKEIYKFSQTKKHLLFKQKLVNYFGVKYFLKNGDLDQKKLSEYIFSDDPQKHLNFISKHMYHPLQVEMRKYLKTKKGLILIDGTVIIENNHTGVSNHNVLLIKTNSEEQLKRLMQRNKINRSLAAKKINTSGSDKEKKKLWIQNQKNTKFGRLIEFTNEKNIKESNISKLVNEIKILFPNLFLSILKRK